MDADKQRIAELVIEIQNGKTDAFNELYKLTSSRAYFVALQITKNEEDAQDVLQDSYIKALEKIGSLDKPESFVSWFHQMVANKSKDSLKKKKPSLFEGGEDEAFEVIPDEDETFTPEKNLDHTELQKAIMEAIDELSEEKRACVLMMYFEEMSVSEIAQSLDLSVSTVKNRLFTARKDLRNSFEKRGITSVYSAVPIGAVIWALTRLSDAVSETFAGSAASSEVLAGVTAASAGSAAAAGAGGAAGTGIAAKAAAITVAQKIVAGVAVAGVVTGSAVGVTTVIKNNRESETTTAAYVEEVTTSPATAKEVFAVVTETGTTITLTLEPSKPTLSVSVTDKKEPTATVAHSEMVRQTKTGKTTEQSTKKTRPTTTRRDYSLDYTKATTLPSTTVVATTLKTTTKKVETTTEKTTTTTKPTTTTTKPTTTTTKPTTTTTKPTTTTTTQAQNAHLTVTVIDYDENPVAKFEVEVPAGTLMDWDYLVELVRSKGYEARSGVFGDVGVTAEAGGSYDVRAEL